MTAFLDLPDEIIARIFRLVRESCEDDVRKRIFEQEDADGMVNMAAPGKLLPLTRVCKRLLPLALKTLYYLGHVWDSFTARRLAEILRTDAAGYLRSLRIDHGESLVSISSDPIVLFSCWLAILEGFVQELRLFTKLHHLHVALPQRQSQNSTMIEPLQPFPILFQSGLRTLSIKGGSPIGAIDFLRRTCDSSHPLAVSMLRLEGLQGSDLMDLNNLSPFLQCNRLVIFDGFHRYQYSPSIHNVQDFLGVLIQPYPTHLSITKTCFRSVGLLVEIMETLGPQLRDLHLSMSEALPSPQGAGTRAFYHIQEMCDPTSPNIPAVVGKIFSPCQRVRRLQLDLVDMTVLAHLPEMAALDDLDVQWHLNHPDCEPNDLLMFLSLRARLTKLTIRLIPGSPASYYDIDPSQLLAALVNEAHAVVSCIRLCEVNGTTLTSDLLLQWIQCTCRHAPPDVSAQLQLQLGVGQ